MGVWGLCQKEPKHVEGFSKVGLRRCYICINKTGATGDVDTAKESTIALREDTRRKTPIGNILELLKIFLDHNIKKYRSLERKTRREKDFPSGTHRDH